MALKPNAAPVRSVPVYAFKDLEGRARERALEWLREGCTSDGALDPWRDTVAADLEAMGFKLKTREFKTMGGATRSEPCVYYDLGYSQGSHVGFEGTCDLAKLAAFNVKKYAPNGDLPALSKEERADLRRLLKADPSASLEIEYTNHGSTRAALSLSVAGDPVASDLEDGVSQALSVHVRALCRSFMASGYAELEHLGSEDSCRESAEANGYTFTEDGRREG